MRTVRILRICVSKQQLQNYGGDKKQMGYGGNTQSVYSLEKVVVQRKDTNNVAM